jgi:hypothetical protein
MTKSEGKAEAVVAAVDPIDAPKIDTDEENLALAKIILDEKNAALVTAERAARAAQAEVDRLQLIVDRKLGPPGKRLYANLAAYMETQRKLREAQAEQFGITGRSPLDSALNGRKKPRITGPVDLKGVNPA